jgi:glycosyltransferase involved in cell wall biosynthesis
MRVALINEGAYPYRADAVGNWCHRLVRGLGEVNFHLVSVVDTGGVPIYSALPNTPSLTSVTLDDRPAVERGTARQQRRNAARAAVLLCRGMLDDSPHSAEMFRTALRTLAGYAAGGGYPLAGVALGPILLDAWRAAAKPQQLPVPTSRDADEAAALLELALRALSARTPAAEIGHAVEGGLATLVALGAKWTNGLHYVMTEHDVYVHHRFADRTPPVRAVLLRFLRALTTLGYAEAAAITPPSERMRRWALHHGADRRLVSVVPPGVDPRDHPPLRGEPTDPAMAWLGPDAELPDALRFFAIVRQAVPAARMVVIGPDRPAGRQPDGVSFTGPVTRYRALFEQVQVVVLAGGQEGMPYPLIEAMLCGRATVCVDDGGLAVAVGSGAEVVPPGDLEQLAGRCIALLTDPGQRHRLAGSARDRARSRFSLVGMQCSYRQIYEDVRRRGRGWQCGQENDERFMNASRRIGVPQR